MFLLLLWVLNITFYILVTRQLYQRLAYNVLINDQLKKFRYYVLVFIILKLPAVINRLILVIPNLEIYPLFVIQAYSDSALGFFNSLVYIKLRWSFFAEIYFPCLNIIDRDLIQPIAQNSNDSVPPEKSPTTENTPLLSVKS